ncbi:hypothetical protein HY491_02055 [Candidatus Woesearchaeota archaeon]|nr:hypothetical protein [Candidatus Woesearchaeota archaeon]
MNREICELIGAFIGDGYLAKQGKRKHQFLIGFAGNKFLDKEYFERRLMPLIKRNFPFIVKGTKI